MWDESALWRLGYSARDLQRLRQLAGGRFERPEDIRRVIDRLGYLSEWRSRYHVQSVRSSLHSSRITCIDGAILAYGLLDLFPAVKRRVLAIHRRDQEGEECGHAVALYWSAEGRVGSFSKSSFTGLGHRDAVLADEFEIAASYGRAYLSMGFEPLYFGVTTLEDAAGDLDWRFQQDDLNVLSERLQARYEYGFMLAR
jgi:hypothetical protein